MNTMTIRHSSDTGYGEQLLTGLQLRRSRLVPMAAIVIAHGILFYLAQSGMLSKAVHAVVPQVMTVSIIAPPAPPAPPAPEVPKTVTIAPRLPTFVPPLPQVAVEQTEPTITLPTPQASQAAPMAAVAAPVLPAPAPATPRTVSGVEYIRPPQTVYPAMSRRLGESGVVTLRVLIGVKGLPEQVTIEKSSGFKNLDEAGRQATLRALFKPYTEDGKAVPVYAVVPINFSIS